MNKQIITTKTEVHTQVPSVPLEYLKDELEPRAWQTLIDWLVQNDAPEIVTKLVFDLSAINYISRVIAPDHNGQLPPMENATLPQITIELINTIYEIETK